jgi:hypothetical protein
MNENMILTPYWVFEARRRDGRLIYRNVVRNVVTDVGANYVLETAFNDGTNEANWYMGLTGATPVPAPADTISSHAGWAEITAYSEVTRSVWNTAAASGRKITNTANKARFTINADSTAIGGAFIVSQNTKGGASGVLFAVAANSGGNQTLDIGQTMDILAAYTYL